jgi:hypothetical protein
MLSKLGKFRFLCQTRKKGHRLLGQVCLFSKPHVIFLSIALSLILAKLILYKPAKQVLLDVCLRDLSINYSMSTQREESLRERKGKCPSGCNS